MSFAVWLSSGLGWAYFIVWSISFYPQAIINARRRSVQGLSLDFLTLNSYGFACYTIYTIALRTSPVVRHEYAERHNGHYPAVAPNDIAFAVHALLLSLFTIGQTCVYKRDPDQKVHLFTRAFLGLATFSILAGIVAAPNSNKLGWLDLLYLLSYIKIAISLIKLIPQALMNYRRKSTVGWSIENIWLDITGGALSLMQLVVDAGIDNDWRAILGNPGKLGLSLLAITFDIVFVLQHYVWYMGNTLTLLDLSKDTGRTEQNERSRLLDHGSAEQSTAV